MQKARHFILALLALSLALTTGCAVTFENRGPRAMVRRGMGLAASSGTRTFHAPYHKVFKAVERTILGKNYPVLLCDEVGGIIDSDYRIHDGLFTLGFVGAKLRSKMLASLVLIKPEQVEVTLIIQVEREDASGTWDNFPVNASNLDLIDSDSYDMYFYNISEHIKSPQVSGLLFLSLFNC